MTNHTDTLTRIQIALPESSDHWTDDPDDLPMLSNAQANYAAAVEQYLRRKYPDADIAVRIGDDLQSYIETDDDRDYEAAAELQHEMEDRLEWSDLELWKTDPDDFDASAYVTRKTRGPGQPAKSPVDKRSVQVVAWVTPPEAEAIDAEMRRLEITSRSAYLRQRLGLD